MIAVLETDKDSSFTTFVYYYQQLDVKLVQISLSGLSNHEIMFMNEQNIWFVAMRAIDQRILTMKLDSFEEANGEDTFSTFKDIFGSYDFIGCSATTNYLFRATYSICHDEITGLSYQGIMITALDNA